MPNHVTNIITLKGDKARIERLLKDISGVINSEDPSEEDEVMFIDFNKIIPMPNSFEGLVSGSITDQAIAVYLAKEENDYSKIDKMLEYPCYQTMEFSSKDAFVEYLINERDATVELGKRYMDNYRKYNAYTWYEWCNQNWGTKWNAYNQSFDESKNEIIFDTAWSGVPNLIQIISEKHPLVNIEYKYADEDFGCNLGRMYFFAGVVSDEYYPEYGSEEAYELASEILGYNPYDDED